MKKKILFIEDESALQRAATEVLTEEGYKMLSAVDGESGLQIAQKEKPDLILLDLILPRKNGFDVLHELKDDKSTQDIPVIVLSNLEETENIEKALALGAVTYLVKANYTLNEVVLKIKGILR